MHRDGKVCWAGFALTSVTVAAVVTATILFTVFPKDYKDSILNFDPSQIARARVDEKVDRFDHRAHSVPGGEYVATDFAGRGSVEITLDGSRSHTHYVEEGPPLVNGFIQNFVWFNNASHIVLGTGVKPTISFGIGVTTLGLTVADNTRDTQTDFTRVVIKSPITEGVYCYFYVSGSVSDDLLKGSRPIFARVSSSIDFKDVSDFPLRGRDWQGGDWNVARCIFRALVRPNTKFSFNHAGSIRMIINGDQVVINSAGPTSTGTYTGRASTVDAQVIYTRRPGAAQLQMTSGVSDFKYDLSKTLPILLNIDPTSSTFEGGGTAKIDGLSLSNDVEIFFGDKKATYDETQVDEEGRALFVQVPTSSTQSSVRVVARSANRESNALSFLYSRDGKPPIKFSQTTVTLNGAKFVKDQITGIKYGPDHRFYVVTYRATVHSFLVNRRMQVSGKVCNSRVLGSNRKALGLAFNYAARQIKLYVATSVLDWKSRAFLTGKFAWANGQIHVLEKNGNDPCLKELKKPVISGLPVSNYDHGVNGLVFDDDGNLRIQVGGATNAGYNKLKDALGGIDESPLSAASLIALMSKRGFDGHVKYDRDDPGSARQIGGRDVRVAMSGWRNSFGINIHSNGFIYATDNGPSQVFGDRSITCSKSAPLPSTTELSDKLGKVIQGKYFGHPNRNRGRTKGHECTFMLGPNRNGQYEPPLLKLESSTDGVVEYHMDTFDGQMKGDLMLSKYAADNNTGAILRVRLGQNGDALSDEEVFWKVSGLSVEMSPWGDIVTPQLWKNTIVVLRPELAPSTEQKFIGVMPARGSFRGGNRVIVTGLNIGPSPVALFDGKQCTGVTEVSSTSFKCIVPPGVSNKGVKVSIRSVSGTVASKGNSGVDYKYMKV